MATAIEWTEETWNPATGCTKVSPGCAHCYAEALTKRYAGSPGWPETFEPWILGNETVFLHPERLEKPFSWKTPRRVFVNSMSDLFHEAIPDGFIDRVFAVMALAQQHVFQVLTKRPERMRAYFADIDQRIYDIGGEAQGMAEGIGGNLPKHYADFVDHSFLSDWLPSLPLPNVWLGVSVENQRWADERIPILLDTPAAVRFISAEPLLGPIDLMPYLDAKYGYSAFFYLKERALSWIIVGGESGPRHRPFDPDWARRILHQTRAFQIPAFIKQLGGARPGTRLEDLPEDLRVREYPR